MLDKLRLFLLDEEGQTSTEYILLVAVAALLVFKFKDTASKKIESITNSVFGNAENLANDIGKGS